MRENVLRREPRPGGELGWSLTEQAQGQVIVELAQDQQHFGQERRNDIAALWWMGSQRLEKGVFESGDFEFDVEEGGGVVASENLVEVGEFGEVAGAGVSDLDVADVWIVADQGAAVGGTAHVELETVGAVRESEVERRERVFGDGAGGAGAAVAEQERAGHSGVL